VRPGHTSSWTEHERGIPKCDLRVDQFMLSKKQVLRLKQVYCHENDKIGRYKAF
jgi:hypothetical protein